MNFTINERKIKLTDFEVSFTYSGNYCGSHPNDVIEQILLSRRIKRWGLRDWKRFCTINSVEKLPAIYCTAIFESNPMIEGDGSGVYSYWFQNEFPNSIYNTCLDKLLLNEWETIAYDWWL